MSGNHRNGIITRWLGISSVVATGVLGLPFYATALARNSDDELAQRMAALAQEQPDRRLDQQLTAVLHAAGFTGKLQASLETRLGRPIDPALANLGRLLFFDNVTGLHDDNTCAGCHAPAFGFGDSQSIAIGIQSNLIVGHERQGPRNQRRAPKLVNSGFLATMFWNSKFISGSGDPFDNSKGFIFPPPEGTTRFPPNDSVIKTLAQAQGEMPPTEITEVAGYTGTKGTPFSLGPEFDQFDDGKGSPLPPPDGTGSRNDPIRAVVLERLNAIPAYRTLFGETFPEVSVGAPIDFSMFGRAIAEFEYSITFADAPVDQFARGNTHAMTNAEKRGALIFWGKGKCIACHTNAGNTSSDMFSDFQEHNIGVPQIAPFFGVQKSNVIFDGPNTDEDFGREQITGDSADRYKFRTAPLRNVAVQPAFFHNGSFTRLEDAIRHHLNVFESARHYNAVKAGVDGDLRQRLGPIEPVLATVDPILAHPIALTESEFHDLLVFVRDGLRDSRVNTPNLCKQVPAAVPSGRPLLDFTDCKK
jgi:cytochrome c peroxidase